MHILLWVLQILLALYNIAGGVFTLFNYEKIRSVWASDLPQPVWLAVGALQIIAAVGLFLPAGTGVMPQLTPVAAGYLVANSLLGCVLFAQYAGFPGILWGVVPALLAAFILYGRLVLSPL